METAVRHINLGDWLLRWDRMQDRYNPGRAERFDAMVELVAALNPAPERIVDLGCGTGSLMLRFLKAFPAAEVVGTDLDPAMLMLAGAQLDPYGPRVRLLKQDLRHDAWIDQAGEADAVVSATALHWLEPDTLARLYAGIARALKPGGVFLNADHAGSASPPLQALWGRRRREAFNEPQHRSCDDWRGFWDALDGAFGVEWSRTHKDVFTSCAAVEEGLPLSWHFDKLRGAGFTHVDCFWRHGGDAVYGGVRPEH